MVYHGRVFAMMSLLTELGILMERLFYKYSAPHGACGLKLREVQLKNDIQAALNLAHFMDSNCRCSRYFG